MITAHQQERGVPDPKAASGLPCITDTRMLSTATAMTNGLPLYTANPGDFEGITELEIVALSVPDTETPSNPQSADADH